VIAAVRAGSDAQPAIAAGLDALRQVCASRPELGGDVSVSG